MIGRGAALAVLVLLGAGWGLTQPLSKIAVSEGYRHFGLIFWQLVIAAAILFVINRARGKPVPVTAAAIRLYAIIALTGTLLPNAASYEAARHLPAGVLSVTIAAVPIFAFPIALLMGNERFRWAPFAGVICGMAGVLLLIGPQASLPDPGMAVFIPLALIAPLFYGFEGNFVARYGTGELDPIQVLLGASLLGTVIAFPLAVGSGQWIDPSPPWRAPDIALIGSSVIHALVYSTYVWLIGRAGAVFASQVAYLVTGFGVFWSMLLLGEQYSGYFWGALAMMLLGMLLVRPRHSETVAPGDGRRQDGAR